MTEHLRRDPSLNPDLSATADPNLPVSGTASSERC